MTTAHARYSDWLASVGNPDHHVVIGPDWWGCLCGECHALNGFHIADGVAHSVAVDAETVTVEWDWRWVQDYDGTMADVHQDLWEQEAF